ncbi:MAG: hypothetical protein ACI8P3_002376 [Saprospiraceae bacterium]|jgi:hypothetical protein
MKLFWQSPGKCSYLVTLACEEAGKSYQVT